MVQIDEKIGNLSKKKLELIFDSGTFVELSAYTKRESSNEDFESVVCGYGAVCGKLAFAFVQDSGRTKGAFSERHSRKIAEMYSLAIKNGAPVIGVFDSAGAVIYDGSSALSAYGRFMKCVSDASGIIPQIAVVDGICGGTSAVIASMFDFTVTIKDISKLYVNPPFVVGKEVGGAEFAAARGLSAYNAQSEAEAFSFARELVSMLPSNNAESAFVESNDDINREVAIDGLCGKALVEAVADGGRFVTLYGEYAENVVLGFASFGGIVSGVVASSDKNGGALDISAARAISKFVSFCDSFSLPVLTLVDSEGLDVSMKAEDAAYASELARLAYAYTSSESAKLTVVTGKAYGASFALLGSKAIGADMVYALPEACISVLSPEASVAFVWNDEVREKTREELEREWKEKCASAEEACNKGDVDDIIDPTQLRQRICASFSMLSSKADGIPSRRHANMPL